MSSKLPPVPPKNRSPKGIGDNGHQASGDDVRGDITAKNPDKLGHQGNSKVNTTHQGYQQDR
ncbi:hypothetical protein [Mesorhizobium sp. LSHC422A00]|uniref:hypothetical protein n=1 Tax=Mesorhizobium sp. LSHC422A00 TaxID=1287294 RepID=UPI000A0094A9|nr:hypothetical protein [Mesorhizobium sp. LSHC422A00]